MGTTIKASGQSDFVSGSRRVDTLEELAIRRSEYLDKMKLVSDTAKKTDPILWTYIFKAVTENLTYENLRLCLTIPCGRDMYYERYRRFFWLLDKTRK